jgi:BsuBI/PstI restriction endonuclease HTH domain
VSLPPYMDPETIHGRLQVIFPEGIPQRNYCVREAATSTIFAMLYIGAVEGTNEWVAPKQIYRMTDAQSWVYAIVSRSPTFR